MVAAANLGVVLVLLLVFLCFLQNSDAIWLSLPASGTKCISEEIQSNVVVLADYVVISDDHVHSTPAISAKVTSPYGNTLHHQENVTRGQFAFTTTEGGNYLACFWGDGHNTGGGDISVNIEWKTGIAAKDWDSVARKEKIEGVELELRKLEGAVEAIHENLLYLKTRDANCKRNDKRSCGLVQSDVTRGLHYGFTCPNMALKTIFSKEKADLEVEGEEKGKVYVFDLVLY